jgi:chemotaxis protein histidine kinase CheA
MEALFLQKLPSRFDEITGALGQYLHNPQDKESLTALHRHLHTMAGSAGTFGFEELGVQARVFESRLKPLLSGTEWSQTELDDYARDIRDYFAAALNLNKEHAPGDIASADASETASPDNQSRLIYLVNQDCRQNQEITTQLEHFGYETVSVEQSKIWLWRWRDDARM